MWAGHTADKVYEERADRKQQKIFAMQSNVQILKRTPSTDIKGKSKVIPL